jgi:hypothetical protein
MFPSSTSAPRRNSPANEPLDQHGGSNRKAEFRRAEETAEREAGAPDTRTTTRASARAPNRSAARAIDSAGAEAEAGINSGGLALGSGSTSSGGAAWWGSAAERPVFLATCAAPRRAVPWDGFWSVSRCRPGPRPAELFLVTDLAVPADFPLFSSSSRPRRPAVRSSATGLLEPLARELTNTRLSMASLGFSPKHWPVRTSTPKPCHQLRALAPPPPRIQRLKPSGAHLTFYLVVQS